MDCPENCEGGYSKAYKSLEKYLYGYQLTKEQKEDELFQILEPMIPKQLKHGNDRGLFFNVYGLLSDLAKEAGLQRDWNRCEVCGGSGVHPDHKEAYELWTKKEPPTGEGYQLWETTSEGSPSSPVFKTLDELCVWCEKHATTFGSFKATKEEWKNMLDDGIVHHTDGGITFI